MQVIQSLAAVFSVLLLLALALWWLRRRGLAQFGSPGARTMHRLQLLERLSLTPQHSLLLVRVDGKTVLIALSPSGCCLLEPACLTGRRKSRDEAPAAKSAGRAPAGGGRGRALARSRGGLAGCGRRQWQGRAGCAHPDHHSFDTADPAPGHGHVCHAFSANYYGAALPAAGVGHAVNPLQSGPAGTGSVSDHRHHAAGRHGDVPEGLGAARAKRVECRPGLRGGYAAAAPVPDPLHKRKGCEAFPGNLTRPGAPHSGKSGPEVLIPAYILSELKAG